MSRFLFTCWPFDGHVLPQLSIAGALRERGHEVAFYTGAGARDLRGSERFHLFRFERVDERAIARSVAALERSAGAGRPRLGDVQLLLPHWLVETIPDQVADLDRVIDEWRPDVIVSDLSLWGPIVILGEAHPDPGGALDDVHGPTRARPGRAPVGSRAATAETPAQRATALAARTPDRAVRPRPAPPRRRAPRPSTGSRRSVARSTSTRPAAAYIVRASASSTTDGAASRERPLRRALQLALRPRARKSSVRWLDARPGRPSRGCTSPRPRSPTATRSSCAPPPRACAIGPVEVIVTTGAHRDVDATAARGLAPNVHVTRWLTHGELLPRCSAMVTAGGTATILSSLAAGVPLVVVPTTWDKPDNARRVVEAGVGVPPRAPEVHARASARRGARRCWATPATAQNARRVAARLAPRRDPPARPSCSRGWCRARAPAPRHRGVGGAR